ncbi:MAG: hypothetical protein SH850_11885 [Planctomycetaceae bacterium]|nr:hypothetical protein [Planctomycetaceae bacterium]
MKNLHSQFFGDGCFGCVMPDFRWDLTLPSGRHVRGVAVDLDSAKAALEAEHDKFVLAAWKRGRLAHGNFVCPLGDSP